MVCSVCNGQGELTRQSGSIYVKFDCWACGPNGGSEVVKCPVCLNSGYDDAGHHCWACPPGPAINLTQRIPPRPPPLPPESFEALGATIGRLVQEKQAAYGDSFGKAGAVMRLMYPTGVPPENIDDALAVVRIVDKLFRIATAKDAFGESPYRDIAGYALLGAMRAQCSKK